MACVHHCCSCLTSDCQHSPLAFCWMLNLKAILGCKGRQWCLEFYAWDSSFHAYANGRLSYPGVAIACWRAVPEECCLWLFLFGRLCWQHILSSSLRTKCGLIQKNNLLSQKGATSMFHNFNGVHQRCIYLGHTEIGLEVLYWSNWHSIMSRWKGKYESEFMKWHLSASLTQGCPRLLFKRNLS